ncbi:MAG: cold shock domain-containing protein [Deltaproteobacteria bacterium]|nr:cold shock domain-containing protein [Deltaproteobacteria bacterium]
MKGVVKWFNDAKGFGFIEHTSGKDVFVHYSVIEADGFKTLKDGEQVEYEIKEGPKGLHAVRVQRTLVKGDEGDTGSAGSDGSEDGDASDDSSDSDSVLTAESTPEESSGTGI